MADEPVNDARRSTTPIHEMRVTHIDTDVRRDSTDKPFTVTEYPRSVVEITFTEEASEAVRQVYRRTASNDPKMIDSFKERVPVYFDRNGAVTTRENATYGTHWSQGVRPDDIERRGPTQRHPAQAADDGSRGTLVIYKITPGDRGTQPFDPIADKEGIANITKRFIRDGARVNPEAVPAAIPRDFEANLEKGMLGRVNESGERLRHSFPYEGGAKAPGRVFPDEPIGKPAVPEPAVSPSVKKAFNTRMPLGLKRQGATGPVTAGQEELQGDRRGNSDDPLNLQGMSDRPRPVTPQERTAAAAQAEQVQAETTFAERGTRSAIELGVSEADAARGTRLALEAGSQGTRHYHTNAHFAELEKGSVGIGGALTERGVSASAAQFIAALYSVAARDHDVVYPNADGKIMPEVERMIGKYIEPAEGGGYKVRSDLSHLNAQEMENLRIATEVFGDKFQPGQKLNPFGGQNEFLSALHSMEANPGVTAKAKVALAGIIESTIPFGESNSVYKMTDRAARLGLMTPEETRALGWASADLANRDVANFNAGTPEKIAVFDENSVRLMRESGTDFTDPAVIARKAAGSAGFFEGLAGRMKEGKAAVFRSYEGYPPPNELQAMEARALERIERGAEKMRAVSAAAGDAMRRGETLSDGPGGPEIIKRGEALQETRSPTELHKMSLDAVELAQQPQAPKVPGAAAGAGQSDKPQLGSKSVPEGSANDPAVASAADEIHNQWRQAYESQNGAGAERWKAMKPESVEWVNNNRGGVPDTAIRMGANGGMEINIAGLPNSALPPQFSGENTASARAAIETIRNNPNASLEELAAKVHDQWLERNGSWAPAELKVSYGDLSRAEQLKDIAVVQAAQEAMAKTGAAEARAAAAPARPADTAERSSQAEETPRVAMEDGASKPAAAPAQEPPTGKAGMAEGPTAASAESYDAFPKEVHHRREVPAAAKADAPAEAATAAPAAKKAAPPAAMPESGVETAGKYLPVFTGANRVREGIKQRDWSQVGIGLFEVGVGVFSGNNKVATRGGAAIAVLDTAYQTGKAYNPDNSADKNAADMGKAAGKGGFSALTNWYTLGMAGGAGNTIIDGLAESQEEKGQAFRKFIKRLAANPDMSLPDYIEEMKTLGRAGFMPISRKDIAALGEALGETTPVRVVRDGSEGAAAAWERDKLLYEESGRFNKVGRRVEDTLARTHDNERAITTGDKYPVMTGLGGRFREQLGDETGVIHWENREVREKAAKMFGDELKRAEQAASENAWYKFGDADKRRGAKSDADIARTALDELNNAGKEFDEEAKKVAAAKTRQLADKEKPNMGQLRLTENSPEGTLPPSMKGPGGVHPEAAQASVKRNEKGAGI